MSGLFGFLSNLPHLGAPALEASVRSLDLRHADSLLRWGIGFHHEGDLLLRRRPADARSAIPLQQILGDVRATSLIGHFGKAPLGANRTEDTYPCRFRNWLYAHSGPVDSSESFRSAVRLALPEFLRADLQSDTANELLFRLFLSCLHDAGGLLGNDCPPSRASQALHGYLELVRRASQRAGVSTPLLNVLVGNGDFLVAARTGGRIAFRFLEGPRDIDLLVGDRGNAQPPVSSRIMPRVSLVYSDPSRAAGRFIDVAPKTLLVLRPDAPPVSEPLRSGLVSVAA